jgi:NMD protein affecting ribosome stability and mRNA decay
MKKRKGSPVRVRRNLQQYGDPYLPKVNPGETAICTTCHAIFRRRHWFFDENEYDRLAGQAQTRQAVCPACHKIRDKYFEGEVTLLPSPFLNEHKEEILNLIRNEEERAKGFNPLERIISINEEDGKIIVLTTDEKLSQRIGRELKKAYQGTTRYRWSEDTKCARVSWSRE